MEYFSDFFNLDNNYDESESIIIRLKKNLESNDKADLQRTTTTEAMDALAASVPESEMKDPETLSFDYASQTTDSESGNVSPPPRSRLKREVEFENGDERGRKRQASYSSDDVFSGLGKRLASAPFRWGGPQREVELEEEMEMEMVRGGGGKKKSKKKTKRKNTKKSKKRKNSKRKNTKRKNTRRKNTKRKSNKKNTKK